MSLYDKEIIHVNGEYKVYVRVQNEYTGQIIEGIRNIFLKDNIYYIRVDGTTYNVTEDRNKAVMLADKIQRALKLYNDNSWIN